MKTISDEQFDIAHKMFNAIGYSLDEVQEGKDMSDWVPKRFPYWIKAEGEISRDGWLTPESVIGIKINGGLGRLKKISIACKNAEATAIDCQR